ncbi:Alpha-L-arabinofuranosidase C [Bienertia sinuspersici]
MFSHIPLYWEWTEDTIRRCKDTLMKIDLTNVVYASMFLYKCNSPLMQRLCEFWCPTMNIVFTVDGETSISLWDLRILARLPMYGAFYDEVVPTTLELEGSKDEKQFLPPSCKRSHVTFEEWCRFWSRAPKRYSTTILTKAVENFSHFGILESWTKAFIRFGKDINCIGNCMCNTSDRLLVDDSMLRQADADFLLSIRSCFLTLRYDNDHVVESYSPQ